MQTDSACPDGKKKRGAAAPPRSAHISHETGRVSPDARARLLGQRAVTIWFTGLSGSGKSSIARGAEWRLHAAQRHVYVLDGDNLRFGLNRDLSFSRADRTENIRRIAEVARLLNEAGIVVLVPVISPFRDDRETARGIIGADRFHEVHVATPLSAETRVGRPSFRAMKGRLVVWQAMSPSEPVPKSHQPRQSWG